MMVFRLVDRARKGWDWEVFEQPVIVLARGRQKTRTAARYQAERALFQLLARGWKRPSGTDSIEHRGTRRV